MFFMFSYFLEQKTIFKNYNKKAHKFLVKIVLISHPKLNGFHDINVISLV